MLLERNIEKMLEQTETSGFQSSVSQSNTSMAENANRSPQINRLLLQDRSREPLDLTDLGLSLDNLSPKCNSSSTKGAADAQPTTKAADVTSSMPELHVIDLYSKVEETRNVKVNEALPSPKITRKQVAEPSKPIGKLNVDKI